MLSRVTSGRTPTLLIRLGCIVRKLRKSTVMAGTLWRGQSRATKRAAKEKGAVFRALSSSLTSDCNCNWLAHRVASDLMEGRDDHVRDANLGRSINYLAKHFQHVGVNCGVVGLGVFFVVPQADGDQVHPARN